MTSHRKLDCALWLFIAAVAAACTKPNPRDCGDGVCSDPAYPFCDVDGAIAGHRNTCIAVSCTAGEFETCRGNDALICNSTGNDFDAKTCEHGCDPTSGCVECLDDSQCSGATPHCDLDTHVCRGCTLDSQCSSMLCDTGSGACVDTASIIYAAPTGADSACGTLQAPCSFTHAFALLDAGHTVIKLLPGTYMLGSLPSLVQAGQVAIVHGKGATIFLSQSPIAVTSGGRLELHDVVIKQSAPTALLMCGTTNTAVSKLQVFDAELDSGSNTAISSGGCGGVIVRTTFVGTQGVFIDLVSGGSPLRPSNFSIDQTSFAGSTAITSSGGSTAVVTNSLFRNAKDPPVMGPVSGGVIDVSFSTFVDSELTECVNFAPGVPPDQTFTNNIMVASSSTSVSNDGTSCLFRYDLMTPQAIDLTNSDHITRGVQPKFRDAAQGDFHLLLGSPAIDTADPTATLDHDLDGVMRPQGAQRDMGAFEYKP